MKMLAKGKIIWSKIYTMSLAGVDTSLAIDPRLYLETQWDAVGRIGGSQINYLYTDIQSGFPNVDFQIKLPDPAGSVLAPTMLLEATIEMAITLPGTGVPQGQPILLPGTRDALRAYPLASNMNQVNVLINGEPIKLPNYGFIGHLMRRFNPRGSLYKAANFCPWYPDSGLANYANLVATTRNPLGGGTIGDFDFARGSYPRLVYTPDVTNPRTEGTLTCTLYEPFVISPIDYNMRVAGIPYVADLQVQLGFYQRFERLMSHAIIAGANGNVDIPTTALSVTSARFRMHYLSIKMPESMPLPEVVKIPMHTIQANYGNIVDTPASVPAINTALNTLDSANHQSLQITYNSIPERIYVAVQREFAQHRWAVPDYSCLLTKNFQFYWNGNLQMTQANTQQLYTSAVDAGYAFPYENFHGSYLLSPAAGGAGEVTAASGPVLCIRPGIDFPLGDGECTGMRKQITISVSGDFHDQREEGRSVVGNNSRCQMCIIAVFPGALIMRKDGSAKVEQGLITAGDFAKAVTEKVIVSGSDVARMKGGSFFDIIKRVLPIAQKVGKIAHTGLSAANSAGLLGSAVMSGGAPNMYGGSALSGGALITQQQLLNRLR